MGHRSFLQTVPAEKMSRNGVFGRSAKRNFEFLLFMAGVTCSPGYLDGCGFVQALVDQTPKFSDQILKDVRPTSPWMGHVSTATVEVGTPVEVTKDRFRHVSVNSTKQWTKTVANGVGCTGSPCDPTEHLIGWGADRLTFFEEDTHWSTPLMCYKQQMHISQAEAHITYIIDKILRPATERIMSVFLMKRHLYWSDNKWVANATQPQFTYQWSLGGVNLDEEIYFDCNVSPSNMYKLVPQMLQGQFMPLMQVGYGGENPFSGKSGPSIELISDNDVIWDLDRLGGQTGVGGGASPNILGNWRFQNFGEASEKYWKYGFSGAIGNYMVRMDTGGMRFNSVGDMGAAWNGGNGNRYRYQWLEPLINYVTTGAGGAAGLGSKVNPAWTKAQYRLSQIMHPKGIRLLYREESTINSELTYMHQNMGGKWQFVTDNLGADVNNTAIQNKRRDKGQFISDFYNYAEPENTEWLGVWFHKAEQMPVPQINTVAADPGYPTQSYICELPDCPIVAPWLPVWGTPIPGAVWGPTGANDGPLVPTYSNTLPPSSSLDQ